MTEAKETAGRVEYFPRAMQRPDPGSSCQARDKLDPGGIPRRGPVPGVAAREASGAEARARAAGGPARKSLEDFSFDHQPGLKRDIIAHLATGAFLTEASNIVLLGPPGTGKPTLATWLGLRAMQLGQRALFVTAIDWVARLQAAQQGGRLPQELVRLRRCGLIVVDELGCIPFEQDAANLFFHLVSSRYKHASLVLTSNLPFARWGDVFGGAGRRLSHDRPHRPPRLSRHPQRLQLPAQANTDRLAALDKAGKYGRITNINVTHFSTRWLSFRPSLTGRCGTSEFSSAT